MIRYRSRESITPTDKTFYDRLVAGEGSSLAPHLRADEDFQRHSVRFLENHDEPRAASSLSPSRHRVGAVLAATAPGMFLVHDGQLDGARVRAPTAGRVGRRAPLVGMRNEHLAPDESARAGKPVISGISTPGRGIERVFEG